VAHHSANIREVAGQAGVSIATVSRITRGVGQVAPGTREKVLAVVAELGYVPNHLGRALVERRHAALGIVFPGLSGPYYSGVIEGFETRAVKAGQSVLILGAHSLQHSQEQVLELAARVDGLVVMGGTISDSTILTILKSGLPTVLLARPQVGHAPTIRTENFESAIELTLHLIQIHGARRLAFIGDPTGSPDVTDRWLGFVEAHRRAGIEVQPSENQPVRVGLQQVDGVLAASRVLDSNFFPDALVCANDETALGAYSAAAARGLRVPEQLAITGWDDILMASLVSPPLTTVRQPIHELGERVAELLLEHVASGMTEGPDIVLPSQFMVGSSCGCSRRREHVAIGAAGTVEEGRMSTCG
jgi:LacI family transcriptional regulator